MIQKRYFLSFVVITIKNIDIFTVYETLFQNFKKILLTIYQNKSKIPGKKIENT